jgi:hypothetical protein
MPDMLVCNMHKARQELVNDTDASLRLHSCRNESNAKHNVCTSFLGTSFFQDPPHGENVGLKRGDWEAGGLP